MTVKFYLNLKQKSRKVEQSDPENKVYVCVAVEHWLFEHIFPRLHSQGFLRARNFLCILAMLLHSSEILNLLYGSEIGPKWLGFYLRTKSESSLVSETLL
jgi:hypothetical protein